MTTTMKASAYLASIFEKNAVLNFTNPNEVLAALTQEYGFRSKQKSAHKSSFNTAYHKHLTNLVASNNQNTVDLISKINQLLNAQKMTLDFNDEFFAVITAFLYCHRISVDSIKSCHELLQKCFDTAGTITAYHQDNYLYTLTDIKTAQSHQNLSLYLGKLKGLKNHELERAVKALVANTKNFEEQGFSQFYAERAAACCALGEIEQIPSELLSTVIQALFDRINDMGVNVRSYVWGSLKSVLERSKNTEAYSEAIERLKVIATQQNSKEFNYNFPNRTEAHELLNFLEPTTAKTFVLELLDEKTDINVARSAILALKNLENSTFSTQELVKIYNYLLEFSRKQTLEDSSDPVSKAIGTIIYSIEALIDPSSVEEFISFLPSKITIRGTVYKLYSTISNAANQWGDTWVKFSKELTQALNNIPENIHPAELILAKLHLFLLENIKCIEAYQADLIATHLKSIKEDLNIEEDIRNLVQTPLTSLGEHFPNLNTSVAINQAWSIKIVSNTNPTNSLHAFYKPALKEISPKENTAKLAAAIHSHQPSQFKNQLEKLTEIPMYAFKEIINSLVTHDNYPYDTFPHTMLSIMDILASYFKDCLAQDKNHALTACHYFQILLETTIDKAINAENIFEQKGFGLMVLHRDLTNIIAGYNLELEQRNSNNNSSQLPKLEHKKQ